MPSIVFSAQACCAFDDAITRTTEALKAQGFGIISDIDVSATLKAKLGVDRPPYRILGACAPGYAMKALDADRSHGAVLGKAMTGLARGETGLVLVLINLQ